MPDGDNESDVLLEIDDEYKAFGIQNIENDLTLEFPQLFTNTSHRNNIKINSNVYEEQVYDEL